MKTTIFVISNSHGRLSAANVSRPSLFSPIQSVQRVPQSNPNSLIESLSHKVVQFDLLSFPTPQYPPAAERALQKAIFDVANAKIEENNFLVDSAEK